ncbi:hypothetical protein L911_1192 [Vibrio fluvialis I21563]|uniref:Uncharacterized protein n=1 Tax=Vibrio fluvialis PG41 TaxID=1336752 RepID=S7IAV1_VIBFL|nr:hypothetical protein L910_0206 [Vibrio fluvialis PG41]EPP25712.1 hypothetical protein L911_1192 [Vibrio fluvialis I21563]
MLPARTALILSALGCELILELIFESGHFTTFKKVIKSESQ